MKQISKLSSLPPGNGLDFSTSCRQVPVEKRGIKSKTEANQKFSTVKKTVIPQNQQIFNRIFVNPQSFQPTVENSVEMNIKNLL